LLILVAANFLVRDPTGKGAGPVFWCIAALMGVSMSLLALIYAGAALISTFLVTAGAFAGLSLWGYITHQNLRGVGSFLSLALSGLIIALIANIILQSPAVNLVLNALGVLIFSGLIASDTQRLKDIYHESTDPEVLDVISNYGALSLYLNFVNLFELLLSLASGRSRR
jgi:FtsH-binding integral membrane protein